MPDLRASLDLPYGQHPAQRYDVFLPESTSEGPLVVCFHAGWWQQGRHQDLRSFCLHLSESGHASASIGYRPLAALGAGAANGQDIIDDAKAGIRKALEDSALDNGGRQSLVLLGSGAGSLIALTAAAQLALDPAVRVRGVIACGVTPTLEHWEGCPSAIAHLLEQFAGGERGKLSPLQLPPNLMPPLLLLHGDSDLDVPAKYAQRLHARAIEAGETSTLAVLSGVGHQFIEQPFERGAKAAMERILPFLAEHAQVCEREALFPGRCDR